MRNIKTYEEFGLTFKKFLNDEYGNYDLLSIKKIYSSNHNLIDLNGVEQCINMEELWLAMNKISNLKGVENLTKLTMLDFGNNKLTSIKGVENLTNLITLGVENNPIDWVDYIDKKGNIWYILLPKSITELYSDKFDNINEYWEFMDKNQPAMISRKFNF